MGNCKTKSCLNGWEMVFIGCLMSAFSAILGARSDGRDCRRKQSSSITPNMKVIRRRETLRWWDTVLFAGLKKEKSSRFRARENKLENVVSLSFMSAQIVSLFRCFLLYFANVFKCQRAIELLHFVVKQRTRDSQSYAERIAMRCCRSTCCELGDSKEIAYQRSKLDRRFDWHFSLSFFGWMQND